MIKQIGIVISKEGNFAKVKVKRSSLCEKCKLWKSCGISKSSEIIIQAKDDLGVKKGDLVFIALSEGIFLKASSITYGIPLLFFLSFAIISNVFLKSEVLSFLFGILGLSLSYLLIFLIRKRFSKEEFNPKIIGFYGKNRIF